MYLPVFMIYFISNIQKLSFQLEHFYFIFYVIYLIQQQNNCQLQRDVKKKTNKILKK